MTRQDFAAVMAYLAAGCGKTLSDDALKVYYDLLHDLPLAVLQIAGQRALLESQYPVFPPVGMLRQLALQTLAWARDPEGFRWERAFFQRSRPRSGIALLPEPLVEMIASGEQLLGHRPGGEEVCRCLK